MCEKTLKQIEVLGDKKIVSSLVEQRKNYLSEKAKLEMELDGLSIHQQKEEIEKEIEKHHILLSSTNHDIDLERRQLRSLEEEMERAKSVLLSDIRHVFGKEAKIEYEEHT